jgi:hypothetical protein
VEKTVIAHRGCLHDPKIPSRAQPDHTDPEHQCAREGAMTTAPTATPGTAKPNNESRLKAVNGSPKLDLAHFP